MIRFPDPDDPQSPPGELSPDDHGLEDDALGHGGRAGLDDTYAASCPYCGEECELLVELAGGSPQSYVEDCPVCCRPWQVRVTIDDEGGVALELEPLDE
jgi:hypothetical protein